MPTELDLDDAVANVSGDRARRELEELRAHCERLRKSLAAVVAIADRKTVEFDAAREALSEAPCESASEIKAQALEREADLMTEAPQKSVSGAFDMRVVSGILRDRARQYRRGEA